MKTKQEMKKIHTKEEKYDDIRIRKVKVLCDKARKVANQMCLKEDDLVIVKMFIHHTYELEKIEGSPIEYLQRRMENMTKTTGKK